MSNFKNLNCDGHAVELVSSGAGGDASMAFGMQLPHEERLRMEVTGRLAPGNLDGERFFSILDLGPVLDRHLDVFVGE